MSARRIDGQSRQDMIKNMRKYTIFLNSIRSTTPCQSARDLRGRRNGMEHSSNFLVIGSGIAGLSFALRAAGSGKGTVNIITKRKAPESSTNYAQGGIATVWSGEDSFESHIEDTHRAGAGLCHTDIVERVVRDAPERIRELMEWGVRFTRRTA